MSIYRNEIESERKNEDISRRNIPSPPPTVLKVSHYLLTLILVPLQKISAKDIIKIKMKSKIVICYLIPLNGSTL